MFHLGVHRQCNASSMLQSLAAHRYRKKKVPSSGEEAGLAEVLLRPFPHLNWKSKCKCFRVALSEFHGVHAGPAGRLPAGAFLLRSLPALPLLLLLLWCRAGRHPTPAFPPWSTQKVSRITRWWKASESCGQKPELFPLRVGMFVIINLTTAEVNMITVWVRLRLKGHSRFLA